MMDNFGRPLTTGDLTSDLKRQKSKEEIRLESSKMKKFVTGEFGPGDLSLESLSDFAKTPLSKLERYQSKKEWANNATVVFLICCVVGAITAIIRGFDPTDSSLDKRYLMYIIVTFLTMLGLVFFVVFIIFLTSSKTRSCEPMLQSKERMDRCLALCEGDEEIDEYRRAVLSGPRELLLGDLYVMEAMVKTKEERLTWKRLNENSTIEVARLTEDRKVER
jgi:uncharacterized membrane protein